MPAEHASALPALGAAALPIAVLLQQPGSASAAWSAPSAAVKARSNPALALLGVDFAQAPQGG
jgi:hypothetical protein